MESKQKKILAFIFIISILLIGILSAFTISIFGIKFKFFEKETIVCAEVSDDVFLSSGYTRNTKGITSYYNWTPEVNCQDIDNECFIRDIEIVSRFLYLGEDINVPQEGYVMVSKGNKICENPKSMEYSNYIYKHNLKDNLIKKDYGNSQCYGIKIHASQYSLVDVFKIKYKLCWIE